jgi:hypothetical protein
MIITSEAKSLKKKGELNVLKRKDIDNYKCNVTRRRLQQRDAKLRDCEYFFRFVYPCNRKWYPQYRIYHQEASIQ